MNYLKSFNESNKDYKINDADFELIENCFLDYIEGSLQGEFLPENCRIFRIPGLRRDFVYIEFRMPSPTESAVRNQIDIFNKPQSYFVRRYVDAKKYLSWEWVSGFIKEIAGDVKRCESYGFLCYFNFYVDTLKINLIIEPKGKIVSLEDTALQAMVGGSLTTSSYFVDDAYIYADEIIKGIQAEYGFGK